MSRFDRNEGMEVESRSVATPQEAGIPPAAGAISDDSAASHLRGIGLAMSIPFMLATGPILGWFIGVWLDKLAGTSFLSFFMLALGFVAGVRSVLRTLREDAAMSARASRGAAARGARARDDRAYRGEVADDADASCEMRHALKDGWYPDVDEEDGETVGTMHYTRRAREAGVAQMRETGAADDSEGDCDDCASGNPHSGVDQTAAAAAAKHDPHRASLLALPTIVASGMWITAIVAGAVAALANRELALGLLAGGLWNLVNLTALWLTFKTALSGHRARVFFTLPIVCIKIPLLYALLFALYSQKLFDSAGLTLGLLVLPAVLLFLALLENKAQRAS